jgi:hypothetical protein
MFAAQYPASWKVSRVSVRRMSSGVSRSSIESPKMTNEENWLLLVTRVPVRSILSRPLTSVSGGTTVVSGSPVTTREAARRPSARVVFSIAKSSSPNPPSRETVCMFRFIVRTVSLPVLNEATRPWTLANETTPLPPFTVVETPWTCTSPLGSCRRVTRLSAVSPCRYRVRNPSGSVSRLAVTFPAGTVRSSRCSTLRADRGVRTGGRGMKFPPERPAERRPIGG